jgi:WD40 repeat protein
VPGYSGLTRPAAFSPDGRWLATTWSDGKLRLWPLPGTGARAPRILELPETTLWERFVFDPKGRYLFAVGNSDRAWIVPLDGAPPRRLPVYSDETLLSAAAVSPSGRLVVTAYFYGKGEKTLRVHDVEAGTTRVFPLPAPAAAPGSASPATGYESGVEALAFADETTLYSSGEGGVRRWRLPGGSQESVWAPEPGFHASQLRLAEDGRTALVLRWKIGGECTTAHLLDLTSNGSKPVPESGECAQAIDRSADGSVATVGDRDGTIRVGRLDGGRPHLLMGHEGPMVAVALSPDRRWVASTGEDDTLRLWPMPDLSKPPLHALPREALIAKLRSLTNLRAVRDPVAPIGWKIDIGPFPGWKDVPTW